MQPEIKSVSVKGAFWFLFAAFCVQSPNQLQASAAPQAEGREEARWKVLCLWKRRHTRVFSDPPTKTKTTRGEYMQLLSPGGRVYFLACRHDFAEALAELKKFPKNDTGSALYVKGFCLGKSREAPGSDCRFHGG